MAMKAWEFATADRIVFGVRAAQRLGELAAPLGRRALVVTGASPERSAASTLPRTAPCVPACCPA